MRVAFEIDRDNSVELQTRPFRRPLLLVNGAPLAGQLKLRSGKPAYFNLADGRAASLTMRVALGAPVTYEVRVDGRVFLPNAKTQLLCAGCKQPIGVNDRFCESCGLAAPTAEFHASTAQLNRTRGTITVLGVVFLIAGLVAFFTTRATDARALASLASMPADVVLQHPIGGVNYTVGALRARLQWEPWGVLSVNMVLACIMGVLAVWARRAPLAAILVAAATYAVLQVVTVMINPALLAKGIFFKIIVIAGFYRGIRAALALRAANA